MSEKMFDLAHSAYLQAAKSMLKADCQLELKRIEKEESSQFINQLEEGQLVVHADFNGEMAGTNLYVFPKDIFELLPQLSEEGEEENALSALAELISMMLAGFSAVLKEKKIELNFNPPEASLLEKERLGLPSSNLQLLNFELKLDEKSVSWWQVIEENWGDSLQRVLDHTNKEGKTVIQGVSFPNFDPAHLNQQEQKNLGLLMDVPMVVTVELGRTKWQLRDVLTIGEGSIIELDKQAGEQVDILVNNNLVARGEVVVVDENFSVRITEIISTVEQIMQRIE